MPEKGTIVSVRFIHPVLLIEAYSVALAVKLRVQLGLQAVSVSLN